MRGVEQPREGTASPTDLAQAVADANVSALRELLQASHLQPHDLKPIFREALHILENPAILNNSGLASSDPLPLWERRCLCVRLLIEHGIPVDTLSSTGETALLVALRNQHHDLATWLIRHGASVNAVSKETGNTPLHLVPKKPSFVRLLLDQGAAVDMTNHVASTPLVSAVQNGNHEVISLLLNAGANVNLINRTGAGALSFAVQDGIPHTVKLLLQAGADPNATIWWKNVHSNGNSDISEYWSLLKVAEEKLRAHADSLSVRQRYEEVVTLLRQAGATNSVSRLRK